MSTKRGIEVQSTVNATKFKKIIIFNNFKVFNNFYNITFFIYTNIIKIYLYIKIIALKNIKIFISVILKYPKRLIQIIKF